MIDIHFDTYYRYDALTQFLHTWTTQYPQFCRLQSIGKSYEERDIWLMTITNYETGEDTDKPAYWIDANIHATELAPSSAALYLINRLLTQYGKDDKVTYALDSRTFYIVPRVNPDGAEWALADIPKYIRSSTRPYPRTDQLDGLIQEDVDEDGRILQMRMKDPHGQWKPHPDEPRLLVFRDPDDLPGGEYYRLVTEGSIQNYDGVTFDLAPPLQGLDLNRQFAANWQHDQSGAGKYPGSEPEPQALMRFITDHPNITGATTYHTYCGVHLRPFSRTADKEMDTQDLHTYTIMGKKGTDLTGYPAVSVYHDFAYDPKNPICGTFDDWLYEQLGIYAWTTEIWSLRRQSGLKDYKYIEWFWDHPVDDDLKILKWVDENLAGDGYVDWYEFDHPQLGKVELGGWQNFVTWRNPPKHLLEKEIAPLSDFVLFHCLASPKLELYQVDVQSHGDTHHIRVVLQNTGWLPTNISNQALKMKATRQLEIDMELPANATLIAGKLKTMLGQLKGWDHMWHKSNGPGTDQLAKVEWVVSAPAGTVIPIVATHPRAGTVRTSVTL